MNDRSEAQLLDDVLAEASAADFRATVLAETLRRVRRRRRWRQTRRVGGILAVLFLAALFARPNRPVKTFVVRPAAEIPAANSYRRVETQPLPSGAVVTTGNAAKVKIISPAATVAQIATRGGGFRFINDEQLLALLGPRPAILIRTGPNSEELVLADVAGPADRQKDGRAN